ncbi:MAG: ABC transporter permease [Ktedonobacteraceae bacterium]|nr:ABC transporter permease [Ktedonobacteraceae bacterium]
MVVSSASAVSTEARAYSSARHWNALMTVIRWELRRLASARSTWIIPLLVFALSCLLEWAESTNTDLHTISSAFGRRTFSVDWLSTYGLFHTTPTFLGMILALFIPFLCTDAVARDLKRRTHELLMTTAIPSWTYVCGRYLVSLLVSLGLACVMLLAIIAVALVMHQVQPSNLSVPPDLLHMTILWAAIFLPPVLILSSMSFALGTLWPRLSLAIKVVMLLVWFLSAPIVSRLPVGNLAAWDPTSQLVAQAQGTGQMVAQFVQQTQQVSNQVFFARWFALEQQLPDMSSWIVPRLVWIGFGLAWVILATLLFRRFRDMHV